MWYTMPDSSKHYPLTITRVKEIQKMNAQGLKPDELEPVEIVSSKPKEVEPEFVDVVGQISLRSLERNSRKRKDKEQQRDDRGGDRKDVKLQPAQSGGVGANQNKGQQNSPRNNPQQQGAQRPVQNSNQQKGPGKPAVAVAPQGKPQNPQKGSTQQPAGQQNRPQQQQKPGGQQKPPNQKIWVLKNHNNKEINSNNDRR